MALVSGAWVNPWYLDGGQYIDTTYPALATVPDWSWLDPSHGFTKQNVDKLRSKTNGKVLISFGGSAASPNFWTDIGKDPSAAVVKFTDAMTDLGADGIDYDYESQFSGQTTQGLLTVMEAMKKKGYIQTMSVMAGSYDVYQPIIEADVLDYVIVMCYNGGMFDNWKSWMQVWMDKMPSTKKKLIIGCCIQYSTSVTKYANAAMVTEIVDFCNQNGLGGVYFWWYSSDAPGADTIDELIGLVNSAN